MTAQRKKSWWFAIRPKGAPACRSCRGTGMNRAWTAICGTCRGWGY
jgi:hypothetical protein